MSTLCEVMRSGRGWSVEKVNLERLAWTSHEFQWSQVHEVKLVARVFAVSADELHGGIRGLASVH